MKMKFLKAIAIIFFLVAAQTSLVRLLNFLPVTPNLPIIGIFLLSYKLTFAEIMALAALGGIFIDLFSATAFGISALALIVIFGASFFLRENIFKAQTRGDFILSGFLAFFCYYPLLALLNYFFQMPGSNDFSAFALNTGITGEMLLNFFFGLILYYLFFIRPRN